MNNNIVVYYKQVSGYSNGKIAKLLGIGKGYTSKMLRGIVPVSPRMERLTKELLYELINEVKINGQSIDKEVTRYLNNYG